MLLVPVGSEVISLFFIPDSGNLCVFFSLISFFRDFISFIDFFFFFGSVIHSLSLSLSSRCILFPSFYFGLFLVY